MARLTENQRLIIIELTGYGKKSRAIAGELGIGKSTVGDFLRRETYPKWWAQYDADFMVKVGMQDDLDNLTFGDLNTKEPILVPDGTGYKLNPLGPLAPKIWKNSKDFNEAEPVTPLKAGPKVLTLDIETAPIMASVWRLFDQNVGLSMIEQDWYCLSWAAKWMHEDQVIYEDKADDWDNENDYELLKGIWTLLDEADIIITQNGKKFDAKKLNARFILNGMKPPSSYRHIDTLQEAKRHFGFTSNKLEYMTDKLCKVYKKLKHGKFPGFELWKECLRGNPDAWQEMKDYNIHDVLSLEELYGIMLPWMKTHLNINMYYDDNVLRCRCGGTEFEHNGYSYTNASKFDRFACTSCGAENRGKVNLLSKEKRASLRMNITA